MNSETIKGRLSQHVKRRLQSQESTENKIHPHPSQQPNASTVLRNQPIIKQEEESESTSVKSHLKKRKMTKKSSSCVESNADEDDKCDKRSDKVDTSLDILTLILNHKKSEFLRNPQIVELLSDMNKKRGLTLSELIQS